MQAAAREMGAPELAIPREMIYLDRIPLLGNGKKDYVTLARWRRNRRRRPRSRLEYKRP